MKPAVSMAGAGQLFFNEPPLVLEHASHSTVEPRWHALGHADLARPLHVAFTLRGESKLIRVISARDMHRKERSADDQDR